MVQNKHKTSINNLKEKWITKNLISPYTTGPSVSVTPSAISVMIVSVWHVVQCSAVAAAAATYRHYTSVYASPLRHCPISVRAQLAAVRNCLFSPLNFHHPSHCPHPQPICPIHHFSHNPPFLFHPHCPPHPPLLYYRFRDCEGHCDGFYSASRFCLSFSCVPVYGRCYCWIVSLCFSMVPDLSIRSRIPEFQWRLGHILCQQSRVVV